MIAANSSCEERSYVITLAYLCQILAGHVLEVLWLFDLAHICD